MAKFSKFGEIVRVQRLLNGVSLVELSAHVGCSASQLSLIETSPESATATVDMAVKVAQKFEMSREDTLKLIRAAIEDGAAVNMSLPADEDREMSALMALLTTSDAGEKKRRVINFLQQELEEFSEEGYNAQEEKAAA